MFNHKSDKMDLGDQYFRFQWNTFDANIALSSQELYNERSFSDITLVSEDLHVTVAHRFVLSRASGTFKKLLLINSSANSTLYLRGISQSVLDLILQFIYTGEVDVPTDEVTDFLAVANNLDISELKNSPQSSSNDTESNSESLDNSHDSTESKDTKTMDNFQDIHEETCKSSLSNNGEILQKVEIGEMTHKQINNFPPLITVVEPFPVQNIRNKDNLSKAPTQMIHDENQPRNKQVIKTYITNINSHTKSKKDKVLVCASCSQSFNDQLSYLRHMRFGHK